MESLSWNETKSAVREVLAEELGWEKAVIAQKWRDGKIVLQPADAAKQSKELPIDAFFKKMTSVREKLRVLEQKINNHPKLEEEEKAELQGYITRAYGSLTTFNVLFRDDDDKFQGQKSD